MLPPDCTHSKLGNFPSKTIDPSGEEKTKYSKCSIQCEKCTSSPENCSHCKGLNRNPAP